jgi:CpcD/allophycocyanin linker domain
MYGIETTGTASLSDYNSRIVVVEVTGASHKQVRNSNYTLRVPLGRLSQTIQRIARTGGKIVSIVMPSFDIAESNTNQVTALEAMETPVSLEVVVSHSKEVAFEEKPLHTEVAAVQTVEIEAEKPEAEKLAARKSAAKEKSSQNLAKKLTDKLPKNSKRTKKARS